MNRFDGEVIRSYEVESRPMRFGLQRESTISYFRRSVKVTEEKTDEKTDERTEERRQKDIGKVIDRS